MGLAAQRDVSYTGALSTVPTTVEVAIAVDDGQPATVLPGSDTVAHAVSIEELA